MCWIPFGARVLLDATRQAMCGMILLAGFSADSTAQEFLYGNGNEFASSTDYGRTIVVLSDVDLDGALDLAVGEPAGGIAPDSGAVHVFSGRTGLKLYTVYSLQPYGLFGRSIAKLGDLNSDGVDDFVAGASTAMSLTNIGTAGKIVVVSGATGATLFELYGTVPGEGLGSQVGSIEDVNADGVPDILAATQAGAVRVISGATGTMLYSKTGSSGDGYGWTLQGLPDIDADGVADFAVGAPSFQAPNPGYVDLISGASGNLIRRLVGDSNNDSFGRALAAIDDLDGDMVADLIVGAPWADNPSLNYGTAWVFSSASGAVLQQLDGPSSNSLYGWSVAAGGDLTGDGTADFIVGAPDALLYAPNRTGAAWVHSGADGSVSFVLAGWTASEKFGSAVGAGDLNGDGVADLAVGSPESGALGFNGDVRVYSGTCVAASSNYCQATLNSLGCTPYISSNNTLSLSGSDDFEFVANNVLPGRPSVFFWGIAPPSLPFANGPFCVGSGLARTPVKLTVDLGGGATCTGARTYAFQQSYVQGFGLQPGVTLFAQFWYRDPAQTTDPAGVGLTDGLRFWLCP